MRLFRQLFAVKMTSVCLLITSCGGESEVYIHDVDRCGAPITPDACPYLTVSAPVNISDIESLSSSVFNNKADDLVSYHYSFDDDGTYELWVNGYQHIGCYGYSDGGGGYNERGEYKLGEGVIEVTPTYYDSFTGISETPVPYSLTINHAYNDKSMLTLSSESFCFMDFSAEYNDR